MKKVIRIVLVDGRELVRHGLRHMLESEEDMKVVGDYASAEEALFEMVRLRNDIVLMGTPVPRMDVIEAVHHFKRSGLNYGGDVIVLAESADYRAEALEAGAAGYLLKDITGTELVQTIKQVYRDRHSSKECVDLVEEAIELVVPPPANATQLLRFMSQLAEILHDGFASIICTVGSWDGGTTISIRPHSTTPSSLLITLVNIPEVDKVEEEPLTKSVFPGFRKKVGVLSSLGVSPSKRFRVTLKETGVARQEPVAVLS